MCVRVWILYLSATTNLLLSPFGCPSEKCPADHAWWPGTSERSQSPPAENNAWWTFFFCRRRVDRGVAQSVSRFSFVCVYVGIYIIQHVEEVSFYTHTNHVVMSIFVFVLVICGFSHGAHTPIFKETSIAPQRRG